MSNGKADDAKIEALMTGDDETVDRYILIELRDLRKAIDAVRQICEQRGTCPVVTAPVAAVAEDADAAATRAAARVAETARLARETAADTAESTARLVEDTARKAAAEAARLIRAEADKAAARTVAVATTTASDLAAHSASFRLETLWNVSTTIVNRLALPVLAVIVTLWLTGKL